MPSFVLAPGLPVRLGAREVRVDVAFGGAFYAIVDAEAAGLPITPARLPELRRAGMEIKHAVEAATTVVHPLDKGLNGIYGTIFTGPPERGDADLKNVTIFADAEVDRSPCGTGTCAVMAVIDAMGLMPPGRPFGHESLIGTLFNGRITGRTRRRRLRRHPARARGIGLDHRRARVPRRRRGPAQGRLPPLTPPVTGRGGRE